MFNYTHEVIINSNVGTLEGGKKIATYTDGRNIKHLVIERAGDYRADLIFPRGEGVVFKTPGYNGEFATLTIGAPSDAEAGTTYQFSVFVKLLDPAALSEYAYPNWASFGKPIVVGFTLKDSAKFAEELAATLKEAIPYNNKFVTVKVDNGSVVLTASMFGMEFDGIKVEKLIDGLCDGCAFDKYVPVEVSTEATATVVPFGTGASLVENYRFPTYANTRYAALNSDETPISGAVYTMYSFSYDSPRPGFGGLSGVGQKVDAKTRHIYWVKNDIVDAFDAALTELGVEIADKKDSSSSSEQTSVSEPANVSEPTETPVGE